MGTATGGKCMIYLVIVGGPTWELATGTAATRRAFHHSDQYKKLNSRPIPQLGSEGSTRSDSGGNHMVGAHVNLAKNFPSPNKKENTPILASPEIFESYVEKKLLYFRAP